MGVKNDILGLFKVVQDEETHVYAEEFAQSKGLTAENTLGALG